MTSEKRDRSQNRLVCAANLYSDGTMILGSRHFDEQMRKTMMAINPDINHWKKLGHEQGFMDKRCQFHSREDAWVIAEEAGQIWDRDATHKEGYLFSENLY